MVSVLPVPARRLPLAPLLSALVRAAARCQMGSLVLVGPAAILVAISVWTKREDAVSPHIDGCASLRCQASASTSAHDYEKSFKLISPCPSVFYAASNFVLCSGS